MRRTTYILQGDNPELAELYQPILNALKDEVASFLPNNPSIREIDGEWPNGSFMIDDFRATYREWRSQPVKPDYLFQMTLEFGKAYSPWKIELNMASQMSERLIIEEVWSVTTRRRKMPFEKMPLMLSFFSDYTCKNEDGLLVRKVYLVSKTRVPKFVQFVTSADRQLPVLLFSPHPDLRRPDPSLRKEISTHLTSSVHVVKLMDGTAAAALGKAIPRHPCTDGAIRVYWPGYSPDDKPDSHNLWKHNNVTNLATKVLRLVTLNTLHVNTDNQEITQLTRKRDLQYRKTKQDLTKSLKLLVETKQAAKESADYKEFVELADQEINDRDLHIEAMEQELNDLRTENRTLRWRLTTAWQEPTAQEETSIDNQIFLSTEARRVYESLDVGERQYWNKNMLSKLLDSQLRNRQSDSRNGIFVYPRNKTGDGRRLFFFLDGEEVYVCELYLSHDDYDRAHRQMKPADHYSGFESITIAEHLIREDGLDYQVED